MTVKPLKPFRFWLCVRGRYTDERTLFTHLPSACFYSKTGHRDRCGWYLLTPERQLTSGKAPTGEAGADFWREQRANYGADL